MFNIIQGLSPAYIREDRNHFVRMPGHPGGISNDGPVLRGVPQGTVLGPLLFLVLLSDISKDINHSSVVSFADDTRVYHQIIDIHDCSLLENNLDRRAKLSQIQGGLQMAIQDSTKGGLQ